MAIQILPPQQSAGALFGAGLGRGLSTGIESLIDMKLQNMQKQQQIKAAKGGLTQILGKDKAEAIAPLTVEFPQLANMLIQQELEAPGQAAYMQALTGLGAPMQEVQPAMEPAGMPAVMPDVQPSPAEPQLTDQISGIPQTKQAMAGKLLQDIARMKSFLPRVGKKNVPKLQTRIDQAEKRLEKLTISDEKERNADRRFDQKMNLENRKVDRQERQDEIQNKLAQDALDLRIKEAKNKETQQKLINKDKERDRLNKIYSPYYDQQVKNFRMAHEDLYALDAMSQINKDPDMKLDSPAWLAISSYAKKLGIPQETLLGTPTQIIQKLVADINDRTAKSFAGTGIRAAALIEKSMKKNPGLYQSPEARQYVIDSISKLKNMQLKEANMAMNDKKKNNYEFYKGFSEKILEKMKPKYEKFSKGFKKRIDSLKKDKPLQRKQRLFERQQLGATVGGGLGLTAGTAAGAIPGIVAGLKAGGALGSIGGPLGAITGAALGGLGGYFGGGQIGSKAAEMYHRTVEEPRPGDPETLIGLENLRPLLEYLGIKV